MNVAVRGLIAALLTLVPVASYAHGDQFEDYSCYSLSDFKVHYCVPYETSLSTLEVTESTVWAHYETENVPVSYNVSIENVDNLTVPKDIEAGYAMTQFAKGQAGVNPPPRARAMTVFDDMAIVEVEAGDKTLNAYFIEVFTPTHIARFDVVDFSPEFPEGTVDWAKIRSGMRYLIDVERYSLGQLSPIDAMEPAPWP